MPTIHLLLILFIKIIFLDNCTLAFKIPLKTNNPSKFNLNIGHIPIPQRSGEEIKWKHPKDTKRLHRYNLKAKGVNYILPNFNKIYLRRHPSHIELLESILSLL